MSVPVGARVFQSNANRSVLFVGKRATKRHSVRVGTLLRKGVKVFVVDDANGHIDLQKVLGLLGDMGVASVLVEGGARTFSDFLESRMADKLIVFVAPKILGHGLHAFEHIAETRLDDSLSLSNIASWNLEGDLVVEAYLRK
jgi:diaminohydroxyphosphoribosylaminopyrimidine deaminase/5-amino-6-(5-phosphoribosylamino)uracil reductase